jgi:hypothetical protein
MRHNRFVLSLVGAAALLCGLASTAQAGIVQVFNAGQLGTTTTVNWDIVGPVPGSVSTYAQAPVGSLIVHINTASGLLNLDTGSTVGGFLPSDNLLAQVPGDLSDLILVGFSQPVRGIGTQIESLLPGHYTGIMDLYNSGGNLLDEITVSANTTAASDGSAPFIGALSSSADIDYAIFSVNNGNPNFPKAGDVAINALDVVVPEPLTLSLFGAGFIGITAMRRRCRSAMR